MGDEITEEQILAWMLPPPGSQMGKYPARRARAAHVVYLRLVKGQTFRTMSRELGVSVARARQLHEDGLWFLRLGHNLWRDTMPEGCLRSAVVGD